MAGSQSVPVAPDAVRVWRGFRLDSLTQDEFFEKLGSIFIPGTVMIQAPVGLAAYIPSVLPREKPDGAPDEIAIVFYEYKDAYDEAKLTVGGRAYSELHGLVFDLKRSLSGFPQKFEGALEADNRYYLFDGHVDWQHGVVNTFVGVRKDESAKDFIDTFASWLQGVQSSGDEGRDGAIASASSEYLVYWEHWRDEADVAGASASQSISRLSEISEAAYEQKIASKKLSTGLWELSPGLEVEGGESFNFEFRRRKEGV